MEGTRQPGGCYCDPEQMMEARAQRRAGPEGAERQFQQKKHSHQRAMAGAPCGGIKGTQRHDCLAEPLMEHGSCRQRESAATGAKE